MIAAWLLLIVHITLAVVSGGHALLYKRDPRAALGWIAVCFAYPIIGPLLYFLFGINRVRTRAHLIKGQRSNRLVGAYERPDAIGTTTVQTIPSEILADNQLSALARSSAAVTFRPLVEGNSIHSFFQGDSTYEAMLKAIARAQQSVCLASYLFSSDETGRSFIDALADAQHRGVEVRVLLDGVGELYSFPRAGQLLKKAGVRVGRFIPPHIIPPAMHINLRNQSYADFWCIG